MKEKKTILILILVLTIGIIGLTVAYFSNSTSLDNLFSTNPYGSTVTETFVSPDNWLPGDITEKTIIATNSGSVDQAVRIKVTEKWLDSNNNELNGWIHEDGSKSNHITEDELSTDERVAIINYDNNSDWTYNNGYYYYNYKLSPNESTSSLIKSVTFNPKTKLDDTCTTTISDGKKTITCNSSGEDYDNATYTLTFDIETVQFNKYMNAWNTDVAILEEQVLFCDAFEVGEVVEYNNAEYYVLKDSSETDAYVVLLKKDFLTAEEVNIYSTDYVSQNGEYPYLENSACHSSYEDFGNGTGEWFTYPKIGCTTNYENSNIKIVVDGWSSNYNNDLVSIDGYKTRLVTKDEAINDFVFEGYQSTPSNYDYKVSSNTPDWAVINDKPYWTMSAYDDSSIRVHYVSDILRGIDVTKKFYIRPVINLKKSVIDNKCHLEFNNNNNNNNNNNYTTYSIGKTVSYNNSSYCVIENSDDKDYITLLKSYPLTYDEVIAYKGNLNTESFQNNDGIGLVNFYKSDTCTAYNNDSGCTTNYNDSFVKIIVDNWSNSIDSNLVEINGYKTRLLNIDELIDNFGYEYIPMTSWSVYVASDETPSCLIDNSYSSWTMTPYEYDDYIYVIADDYLNGQQGFLADYNAIRPVINLKKCAIDNTCE